MPKSPNLTGLRFGRLLAGEKQFRPNDKSYWLCKCDCGCVKQVRVDHLVSGRVVSCGCYSKDHAAKRSTIHGHNRANNPSKTYTAWSSMRQRCGDKNNKSYHNYGERGILVCKRWSDFRNFLEDMGERPAGKTLDRVDNNGNYSRSNCRWATPKEQMRNTRVNRKLTFNGETHCLIEWSELVGISHKVLHLRLFRYNWSIEKALTVPVRKFTWHAWPK